ncbi:glycosyltransferase [Pseudomonas sp. 102515]|uniref:glycosyltransferase n=1 Tax=Pseudomonas sp. 102515 TaxID=3071568 RepID=UPI0028030DEE|nr:glycosyltransferase [Pseudomonas sp. 102515]MDQ7912458.1 glycosyltransferase [Pseudomonas sp. 102515]
MKAPAIVAFLWDNQLPVLREFFRRHGPLTLITLSPYVSQGLLDVVAEAGSKVFALDKELDDAGVFAVQRDTSHWQARLQLWFDQGPPRGLHNEDWTALRALINTRLQAELPTVVTLLESLARAQRDYRLSLVLGSEDVMLIAKVTMLWARTQGVPSLHLSHALALNDPYTVHGRQVADITAVYGQRGLEGYLDYGVPPERLRVTGNPAWDGIPARRAARAEHAEVLRARHGLRVGEPVVVFGTTWASGHSAHGDQAIFELTVAAFIDACERLFSSGLTFNAVIKDRPPNFQFGETRVAELLRERQADPDRYFYLVEDGPLWPVVADVLIAVDSNYCVEALLSGTAAINLRHPGNMPFGPCYAAEAGIADVTAQELPDALGRLLRDPAERDCQISASACNAPYYNLAQKGDAAQRVAQLMGEMAVGLVPRLLAWLDARLPIAAECEALQRPLDELGRGRRLLGILILDADQNSAAVQRTLASLQETLGKAWTAVVVSPTPAPITLEAGVEWLPVGAGEFMAVASARMQEQGSAACDWWLTLDAGGEFTRSGLLLFTSMLARLQLQDPGGQASHACFADELQRSAEGAIGACFRPDFNLDLLLSFPALFGRHWAVRQSSLLALGGLEPAYGTAAPLDLLLRVIQRHGGAGIEHLPEVLLVANSPALSVEPAEQVALEQHLQARGYAEARVEAFLPRRYLITYGHQATPSVSVIIPVLDELERVQRCLDSLLEQTRYARFEVLLVDCGSRQPATQRWLNDLEALGAEQVKVWRFDGEPNRSALINAVAQASAADFLLLLEPSCVLVQPDWLEVLLDQGQRPEVGAVGPRICDPQGRILEAGLLLGLDDAASAAFAGEDLQTPGYLSRLQLVQDYSALGGTCLLLKRELILALDGWDAERFPLAYGSVDFCLRLRQAGYLNVWTPQATVVQEGLDGTVVDRQRATEREALQESWLPLLARDPAYNPHLSLAGNGFTFAYGKRRLQRAVLPQILVCPADDTGCGHYRVRQPMMALREAGLAEGLISPHHPTPLELERLGVDAVVFQRQITDAQRESLGRLRKLSQSFCVFELDDYLPNLPLKSTHRGDIPKDILKALRQSIATCDRLVVSTLALGTALAGMNDDICVVPNYLPIRWWGDRQGRRRQGRKPRVGWGGGSSHTGDLELVADVVQAFANDVEWVFFGMCPDRLRPYVHEYHPGVFIDDYPAKLASLNLDLAIAPLEDNLFNRCKTNLRLLEYGACGFPVICSDIEPYQGDLHVTRVRNRFKDWRNAIFEHLQDLDSTARHGDLLRQQVLDHWLLEGANLQQWQAAWLPR